MGDDLFDIDVLSIDEAQLEAIRSLLKTYPQLGVSIGEIQTFKIVIDLNMVYRELRRRFRAYGEMTLTEQLVSAEVIELHMPAWGRFEIEKPGALKRAAAKLNMRPTDLAEQWRLYQTCVIFDELSNEIVPGYADVADDNDTPYAVTMDRVGAIGVLSADKNAFDGAVCRRLSREHIEAANVYVGAMAEVLGLRLSASAAGIVSILGLVELSKALKHFWVRSPDWAQLLLVCCASAAALSPTLRGKLVDACKLAYRGADAIVGVAVEAHNDPTKIANAAKSLLDGG